MTKQKIELSSLNRNQLGEVPSNVLQNYNERLSLNFTQLRDSVKAKQEQLAKKVTARQKVGDGSLLTPFTAGGLNDINRLIWPFFYTTGIIYSDPSDAPQDGNFGVSAEADFVATHMTVSIYEVVDLGGGNSTIRYLDRENSDNAMVIQGLKLLVSDSQSTRQWMQNPVSISKYGDGQRPYYFDEPQLIEKNSNIKATIINNSSGRVYLVDVVLHGYRVRIEDIREFYDIVASES
jgi:hypothetical protein